MLSHKTHSSGIVKYLLWLPTEQRIKFKLAMLTHNTLCSTQPAYLHSLLNYHIPTRSLRSANTKLSSVLRIRTTFASCGFSVAVWNSFQSGIRHLTHVHRRHPSCLEQSPWRRLERANTWQILNSAWKPIFLYSHITHSLVSVELSQTTFPLCL